MASCGYRSWLGSTGPFLGKAILAATGRDLPPRLSALLAGRRGEDRSLQTQASRLPSAHLIAHLLRAGTTCNFVWLEAGYSRVPKLLLFFPSLVLQCFGAYVPAQARNRHLSHDISAAPARWQLKIATYQFKQAQHTKCMLWRPQLQNRNFRCKHSVQSTVWQLQRENHNLQGTCTQDCYAMRSSSSKLVLSKIYMYELFFICHTSYLLITRFPSNLSKAMGPQQA